MTARADDDELTQLAGLEGLTAVEIRALAHARAKLIKAGLTKLAKIRDSLGQREALYAERRRLFVQLRDAGCEHQHIAKAAGVTVPAVIQQVEKARDEAVTAE